MVRFRTLANSVQGSGSGPRLLASSEVEVGHDELGVDSKARFEARAGLGLTCWVWLVPGIHIVLRLAVRFRMWVVFQHCHRPRPYAHDRSELFVHSQCMP